MMLHFDPPAEWDFVVEMCPITLDGVQLSLERSEDSSNCFTVDQPWLVTISATNFPDEH